MYHPQNGDPQKSVTTVRRELGMIVRNYRKNNGDTQGELAAKIGCTQPKIQKIENGTASIQLDDVDLLIDALGIPEDKAEKFRSDVRWVATMSRNHDLKGKPNWFNKFLILESDASEIRSWTGERIPGILQSPHYMLGMFEADGIPDVTHFIRAREGRKAVLSGPHPPKCEFIISASYFKRLPHAFNGAIVRDQIQELIRAIDAHPHIAVLILPFEANLTYIPEDFTLFRLRDEKRQHVAWIENLHIGRETKKPDEVNQYHDRWNILRHTAMSRNESRAFLDNLLGEFERRP